LFDWEDKTGREMRTNEQKLVGSGTSKQIFNHNVIEATSVSDFAQAPTFTASSSLSVAVSDSSSFLLLLLLLLFFFSFSRLLKTKFQGEVTYMKNKRT
jgi:predicted PurR-regulated permease PerM